jgi:hypothetical protein
MKRETYLGHVEQKDQDNQQVDNHHEHNQQEGNQLEDNPLDVEGNQLEDNPLDVEGSHVVEGMPLVVEGRPQVGNHEHLELIHELNVRKLLCQIHRDCRFHLPFFRSKPNHSESKIIQ